MLSTAWHGCSEYILKYIFSRSNILKLNLAKENKTLKNFRSREPGNCLRKHWKGTKKKEKENNFRSQGTRVTFIDTWDEAPAAGYTPPGFCQHHQHLLCSPPLLSAPIISVFQFFRKHQVLSWCYAFSFLLSLYSCHTSWWATSSCSFCLSLKLPSFDSLHHPFRENLDSLFYKLFCNSHHIGNVQ